MEKLLLIGLPDPEKVRRIAERMKLRAVTVLPEQYIEPIGSLAGYTDVESAGTSSAPANLLPETGLLVMCGLKNNRIDRLLSQLRSAGISIPHKAILTPSNKAWNVYQLAQELERERWTMENS